MTIAIPQGPSGYWFSDAGVNQAYMESPLRYVPMFPQIFGPVPVDATNEAFLKFSAGQYLRKTKTEIPITGGNNIQTFAFTKDTWEIMFRSLEIPVPSRIKGVLSRAGVDSSAETTIMVRNQIDIDTDQAMLQLINTTNLPLSGNNGYDATAAPWSNPASDALAAFTAARKGLANKAGRTVRIGFGNFNHQIWLSMNTAIRQTLSVGRDIPGEISAPNLALATGLDAIVFFPQTIVTSNPALAAETFEPAWPDSKFFVATVATGGSMMTPGFGRAPYWTDPAGGGLGVNDLFVETRPEAVIARAMNSVGFKIIDLRMGFLIGNIS